MEAKPDKDNPEQPRPDPESPDLGPETAENTPDADKSEALQDRPPGPDALHQEQTGPTPKNKPASAGNQNSVLPRYSRREVIWLAALGLALLLIVILSLQLFFRDVNTTIPDDVDFPVEGKNVVVKKIDTFWRKVDRERDVGVQLKAKFIPAAEVTLKSSGSGSLRFFFENPEGERIGDPVTLAFSDGKFEDSEGATTGLHSTGGLEDLGAYNEYLTEKVHFWHLIVMEGTGLQADGSSYEEIIRMRISPKRR